MLVTITFTPCRLCRHGTSCAKAVRTIKLLLVDDERLTREGLRESLVRDIPEIDEVLEAGDGQEALDLAVAQAPEIILTDVRMPHMDGVTFASKIHALAPAASIIFMSGYSDKEYLQAAIRVRAVSYVEKPVSISEVEAAVREAMAYHEQINRSLRYTSLQHREKEAQLSLLLAGADEGMNAAAPSMPAGGSAADHSADSAEGGNAGRAQDVPLQVLISGLQKEIGFPSAGRNVYTALLLKTFPVFTGSGDPMLLSVSGALDAASDALPVDHILGLRRDFVLVVWLASRTGLTDYTLDEITRRLTAPLPRSHRFFLAVGPACRGAAKAPESCAGADALLSSAFYCDYNTILRPPAPQLSGQDIPEGQIRSFAEAADEHDTNKLLAIGEEIFEQLCRERCVRPSRVRDAYFKLYIALERGYAAEQGALVSRAGDAEELPIWDRIQSCRTFRELHGMLVRDIREAERNAASSAAESGPAALMADYIRRNYRQDTLSVRDISSCAGLSTAYACTVFKAKTGKTMNQYLTDYRIEKAKHLLEDPRIRISEISSQVGYLDGNYFGKSFKKVTGLTPSEYREKLLS